MEAGRFLPRAAFSLLGLLTLFAPVARPCAASPLPVGLEARGVDPWIAWRQRGDLDVRDAFNRPVSRAVIERQLREGLREAAVPLASVSGLPHAARVLRDLERLALRLSGLARRRLPGPRLRAGPAAQARPSPRPQPPDSAASAPRRDSRPQNTRRLAAAQFPRERLPGLMRC